VVRQTLLQYFAFLSKTIDEALDLLEWVARDTYEFENIMYAFGLSCSDPCVFHARSSHEETFVTSYGSPTFTPKCVLLMCTLCYAFSHNSDSCPQYVQLKAKIKNSTKITFNSMEHMMGEKFSNLVQKQNQCNSSKDKHAFEGSPLGESCEEVVIGVSSLSLELIDPITHTSLKLVPARLSCSPPSPSREYS